MLGINENRIMKSLARRLGPKQFMTGSLRQLRQGPLLYCTSHTNRLWLFTI